MKRYRVMQLVGLIALASAGCRVPSTAKDANLSKPGPTTPPPIAASGAVVDGEGSYLSPPFGTAADVTAATAAQASDGSACNDEPPPTKRGWRSWLPTKDHSNDPRRERGQFTDGWYEPEYRGMTD